MRRSTSKARQFSPFRLPTRQEIIALPAPAVLGTRIDRRSRSDRSASSGAALGDVGPRLVKLDGADMQAAHQRIVENRASLADALRDA